MDNEHFITFRVYKDDDEWLVQGHSHDFAAQSYSLESVLYEAGRVLSGHVVIARNLGKVPLEDIQRAKKAALGGETNVNQVTKEKDDAT